MSPEAIPAAAVYGVLLVVALFWLFLPVLVWSQLRQVIKLLREIRDLSAQVADNTRKPGEAARSSSSVRYGA